MMPKGSAQGYVIQFLSFGWSRNINNVRWTALYSGGLKSLWLPDEGGYIQKRG